MKHLLSDEAFRSYLIDGYVVIDPVSLGDDFHNFLPEKLQDQVKYIFLQSQE